MMTAPSCASRQRKYLQGSRADCEYFRDLCVALSVIRGHGERHVDATPLVQWFDNATRDEIDALVMNTPVRPFSECIAIWFTYPAPDKDGLHRTSMVVVSEKGGCLVVRDGLETSPDVGGHVIDVDSETWRVESTDAVKPIPGFAVYPDAFEVDLTLCALALLNVRNVGTHVREVSRGIRRSAARNAGVQGTPRVTYRTLTLTPMPMGDASSGAGAGFSVPLHLVRGHFATYTEANKLFGRLTGTFWIPTHARGSAENGEVRKTYRTPKEGVR